VDQSAGLAGTPELDAEEAETRRSVERTLGARPVDDAHPRSDVLGMRKADPNAPRTDAAEYVAGYVDGYPADAYADQPEDDDAR
jgi:hypothetical protein